LSRRRRVISLARIGALFEESALHRIARQRERCPKVFAGGLDAAAAKLKLAERSSLCSLLVSD